LFTLLITRARFVTGVCHLPVCRKGKAGMSASALKRASAFSTSQAVIVLRPGPVCENLAHVGYQRGTFILKRPQRRLYVGGLKGLAFIIVRKLKHL